MPELPADSKEFINSGFAERLEAKDPPTHDVLIEVEPSKLDEVARRVSQFRGVSVDRGDVIGGRFVPAVIPQETIPNVARVEGVVLIHQDQPVGVLGLGRMVSELPLFSPENDPIRSAASDILYDIFSDDDVYVGRARISEVEVPNFNFAQMPPGDPFQIAMSLAERVSGNDFNGVEFVPSVEVVEWVRDSHLTDGAISNTSKVAIIDTGHTPTEPENNGRSPIIESHVPGEPGFDFMGHGCASPDTRVHTTLTGIDTMKGVWDALTERCETEPLDNGADQGDTIPEPAMANGHHPLRVQTLNKETGAVETKPVDEMYRIEVDEDIYKVTLASGTTLELTPWHPTLVFRGGKIQKVRADELVEGDGVLAPDTRDSFYGSSRTLTLDHDRGWYLTKEKAWAVGAYLGDGYGRADDENNQYAVSLSNNNLDMHKQFADALSDVGRAARLRAADGSGATEVSASGVSDPAVIGPPEGKRLVTTKYGKEVVEFVETVCGGDVFGGEKSASITVPEAVENSRESVIGAFLAGYFDADGHVKAEKPKVIFSTSSEKMSEGLVYLLSEVGIDARVGVMTDKRDADVPKAQTGPSYRVIISGGADLQRFVRLVSGDVVLEDKRKRLMERLYEADFDNYQVQDKTTVGDARMDPVVGIETEPYEGYFYDFHIEDNHNYVAGKDGFAFISNSWCTNMVTGNAAPGFWGTTAGVAPGSNYAHYKALNTFPGFGKTSWILRSMDRALDWGADVISMSLGGQQQGGVSEDPYARFIRENCKENAGDDDGAIFVAAAGNCLPANAKVLTPDGPRRIHNVHQKGEGQTVLSYNRDVGVFEEKEVTGVFKREMRESESMLRVKTDEGHVLELTEDHPVLISDGYTPAKELELGDEIFTHPDVEGEDKVPDFYGETNPGGSGEDNPAYERVEMECENCGEVRELPPWRAERVDYCSQECHHDANPDVGREKTVPRENRSCEVCGGGFTVPETSDRRYCSPECVGEMLSEKGNAGQYETGHDPWNKDKEWPDSPGIEALIEWRENNPEAAAELAKNEAFVEEKGDADTLPHTPEVARKGWEAMVEKFDGRPGGHEPTEIEGQMYSLLDSIGVEYETEYPVGAGEAAETEPYEDRGGLVTLVDVALPERKVAIYTDGDYWHDYPEGTERDARVTKELEARGWDVYRFWGSEMKEEPNSVAETVKKAVVNGATVTSIEEIDQKKVYDITVEDNHNFVANGLVVHNSGPDKWEIGTPGISPKALTVASWSMMDQSPAVFTSRGPQGQYYSNKDEEFQADKSEFGENEVVKPDVAAPGGGRENFQKQDELDELLFQSMTGWYDGLRDGLRDARGSMKGTSMATPVVAGLVKRLYDAGEISTAADVKAAVRSGAVVEEFPQAAANANESESGKNIAIGHGVIRESLFE